MLHTFQTASRNFQPMLLFKANLVLNLLLHPVASFPMAMSPVQASVSTTTTTNTKTTMPGHSGTIAESVTSTLLPEPSKTLKKTVYLIRHAESLENVAYKGARRVQAAYSSRQIPEIGDVVDAFKLTFKMFKPSVMNAAVSELGQRQISQLHENLAKDNFLVNDPDRAFLLVHSPLQRAKQTAYGAIFGPAFENDAAPPPFVLLDSPGASNNDKQQEQQEQQQQEKKVVPTMELESLKEVNPAEIIMDAILFSKTKTVDRRIADFEAWLESRDEDIIVVVGHSVYMKRMLNLPETFNNCDVWELEYDASKSSNTNTNNNNNNNNNNNQIMKVPASPRDCGEKEKTVDLPRNWQSLRRLYRYTPESIPEVEDEVVDEQ